MRIPLVNSRHVRQIVGGVFDASVDKRHQAERIDFMEENVFLPVKVFVIGLLCYFIFFSGAFKLEGPSKEDLLPPGATLSESAGDPYGKMGDVPVGAVKKVFWAYCVVNLISAYFLLRMKRYKITTVQWIVVVNNLVDVTY